MDDIVKDVFIESRENLDRLDQELVKLESDPTSKELLASIFRTIHTIKEVAVSWDLRTSRKSPMPEKACFRSCAMACSL